MGCYAVMRHRTITITEIVEVTEPGKEYAVQAAMEAAPEAWQEFDRWEQVSAPDRWDVSVLRTPNSLT